MAYLHTGNSVNIKFYSSFGFEYTGEALMGIDNPKWNDLPVPVPLVRNLSPLFISTRFLTVS